MREDFLDRMQRVVAAGKVQSMRAWLLAALGEGKTGYFSSRMADKKAGREVGISTTQARKLAAVAGVRWEWLVDGVGPMLEDGTTPEVLRKHDETTALQMQIARCEIAPLREALMGFILSNGGEAARHAVTHFLFASYSKLEKRTVAQWGADISEYHRRVKAGLSPIQGREMTDED